MKKRLLAVLALFTIQGCSLFDEPNSDLPEGVKFIEESKLIPGKAMIPYQKYQLENGLTIILSPDTSDPLVHVDITYHVGSAREEVGKSGFAHFFEHMMFQGSKHVENNEHFKIITEAGGSMNGTTNADRTNYYQTVPANQLEKVLWLESDRMGLLLDAVSQKKFEIQRATVKNERAQNYDNRPYGLIWEKMAEAMYPEGHPYSWQTIGYVEDLDRVNVNDLKAFFLRWYGPNNAVLTIGGDIDKEQTLEWVKQYFGSIPKGPSVENEPKQPVALPETRFITLEDNIQQPMILLGWPTTYRGEETEASLNALASELGGGASSILYKELVATNKAVDVSAFHRCNELACEFYVYAMAHSGDQNHLEPLYNDIKRILKEFEGTPISEDSLERIRGNAEASAVFALQSVHGKVSQLASNETYYGQPDRLQSYLKSTRNITKESIKASFQQYILNKPYIALSVVPKGESKKPVDQQIAVREASFITPKRTLPEYAILSESDLTLRTTKDTFDRSIQPKVAEAVEVTLPPLYRHSFGNGAKLIGTVSNETPTIDIQIYFPAGERYTPDGKQGLAAFTAAMMQEGTQSHTLAELQAKLDKLGSHVGISANVYSSTLSISSLTSKLPETLAIVEETLFEPAFRPEDFERVKKQTIEGLVYQQQKPNWLASQATREVLFGESLYAQPSDGDHASIQGITLEDIKSFYQDHYTPSGANVVVVGSLNQEEVLKSLTFFEQWKPVSVEHYKTDTITPLSDRHIYLIDKPNAPQSIVRYIRQGQPFDLIGEVFKTQLVNFPLAGNFNSRLNLNLREDKGYTYGAGGYYAANRDVGAIVLYASVRADTTLDTIKEIEKEMQKYSQQGITKDELAFMRLAVAQKDALKYETPSQKASLLYDMLVYGLDEASIETRNEIVASISQEEVNELAQKWFSPDDYQIIVVGDAKTLRPQLESLDIPVEILEISLE
ncbi:insulinase family protein [Vibrio sp.]|nr:insulinase family protein [Vibrio sp.]